jgi:hypothetical protein
MAAIYRYLTDDGLVADGSNLNANVDGSSTAVPFYIGPPAGEDYVLQRMIVTIKDNAVVTADNYGGIDLVTAGTGVNCQVTEGIGGKEVLDLFDNTLVKSMAGWGGICYDVAEFSFGSGDNYVVVRWTFAKSGKPLVLRSVRNEKLVVTINDNLSALTGHTFFVQGYSTASGEGYHGL